MVSGSTLMKMENFLCLKKGVLFPAELNTLTQIKGMTANNWVQLPNGGWAWAQSSGALPLVGTHHTPNGKTVF